MDTYLKNVHEQLPIYGSDFTSVTGDYHYYHYRCDGFEDVGWGCGYRTLQTLCSWARHQLAAAGILAPEVPSIPQIQTALVHMGDKPSAFRGSREWIGSVEVALCMDYFYDIPCKVVHVRSGAELSVTLKELGAHFTRTGAPVMMGGSTDNASKGIMGTCEKGGQAHLLILDPHYYAALTTVEMLVDSKMLLWRSLDTFLQGSFYNLCLPQYKAGTHQPQLHPVDLQH